MSGLMSEIMSGLIAGLFFPVAGYAGLLAGASVLYSIAASHERYILSVTGLRCDRYERCDRYSTPACTL